MNWYDKRKETLTSTYHSDKKQSLKHTPSLSHSQPLTNENIDIIPEPEPTNEKDHSQSIHGTLLTLSS